MNVLSSRLQGVKNNGKSLNFCAQKVVAVAYRSWSFTRGSNFKTDWGNFGVWEVDAYERWSHGGLTVLQLTFS